MADFRIRKHPILTILDRETIPFSWKGKPMAGQVGDTISAALFAHGIRIFGHHPKDKSPQGIFCANGQCSQCMVIANSIPVKSCMELLEPGMQILPADGLPILPKDSTSISSNEIPEIEIDVLIIGGGPAGLSAGIELGKSGAHVILIDDKHRLGGKLVLQTHRFFGSVDAVYASTRGIDIATKLEDSLKTFQNVEIWTKSTALAVFSDKKVGILRNGNEYVFVKPKSLLVAAGAREKFLSFKGNTLPGVYGAGAFQTLVNRDLVRPAEKLFIVGGGNVGLIAGYHALQADIDVVGLVEALPECGGYKVHKDKLVRMGVPIYTSHTVLSANGTEGVESVTIAKVDSHFLPISGSEQTFECDSLLIAVGLDPVDELYRKAIEFGLPAFVAGDAEEIAEASAAIFSGKIKGHEIAQSLGIETSDIPQDWYVTSEILKSKPGSTTREFLPNSIKGVIPVMHCTQEIPCNPCSALCSQGLIKIATEDIRKVPEFIGTSESCKGCLKCVIGCPGLAITLVDYRQDPNQPLVTIPFEFGEDRVKKGDFITVMDTEGFELDDLQVTAVRGNVKTDRTWLVQVKAPREYAERIAGIQVQSQMVSLPVNRYVNRIENETIVCRCERVTAGEIREVIHQGIRDINEIKTVTRAGMGACGAKTCDSLIKRIFREEGIPVNEIIGQTKRPLFIEVPLGIFAGEKPQEENNG
jgi:NADPH-dependent 2,4-dienoyl-CoA reductase/sulfur reductase-like enzyme/Fe-S-cluster-containing hydrogenase component 2/bacterioferritin-associated ferredoxin